MTSKIAQNTKKIVIFPFFGHMTVNKPFLGMKTCPGDLVTIFTIVGEIMSFLNNKSAFSQLLSFLRYCVPNISKNAINQPFFGTLA